MSDFNKPPQPILNELPPNSELPKNQDEKTSNPEYLMDQLTQIATLIAQRNPSEETERLKKEINSIIDKFNNGEITIAQALREAQTLLQTATPPWA